MGTDGAHCSVVDVCKIAQENWLVFVVPEECVSKGGLKLRVVVSGRTADLPERIERKRTADLK